MKLVFFGTSEFGAIILGKLVQADMAPVLVVTTPDMPSGRKLELTPPPVKLLASKFNLKVFQPEDFRNLALEIKNLQPDLFVLAAYGRIIPKELLEIPKRGSLNVHPSLLPKYRGPSPVQTAILNGEEETGVTIMLMDEKVDHGPILTNEKLQITNNKYTYEELHNKLAEIGANLLIKTIPDWFEWKIKAVPQDHSKATFTKMFTKKDGRIDWSKPADYAERQIRAFDPWPGTFTTFCGKIIKILKTNVVQEQGNPGKTFQTEDKKLGIYAGKDALVVEELQLEGGKPTSSKDFLLGHKEIINAQLL